MRTVGPGIVLIFLLVLIMLVWMSEDRKRLLATTASSKDIESADQAALAAALSSLEGGNIPFRRDTIVTLVPEVCASELCIRATLSAPPSPRSLQPADYMSVLINVSSKQLIHEAHE